MKFVCPVCGYVEEFDGDQLPEDFKCCLLYTSDAADEL